MNKIYKFKEQVANGLQVGFDLSRTFSLEESAICAQDPGLHVLEHARVAVSEGSASGKIRLVSQAREPLPSTLLAEEAHFYSQYPWCLNAFPTVSEVVGHLTEELSKLDQAQDNWQRSEVITNIFLLACTITDTIDDHLLGNIYDFSKIGQVLPFANLGVRAVKELFDGVGRLRAASLSRLLHWRQAWGAAVTQFLRHALIAPKPDHVVLLQERNRLVSLLPPKFPRSLWSRRPKVPAFFRSRDFAPFDCLELGRKFVTAFPERKRPVMVMGLRTAGSFLAPLLCAYLSDWLQETDWLAVRPRKALALWEQAALRQAAQKKARVLIIDESIHSGQTLAHAIELLRQTGFSDEDIVVLNPVEPAFPKWRDSHTFQSLRKMNVITLEPAERYKQRLLDSSVVGAWLEKYFKARGYAKVRVVANSDLDPKIQELNQRWRAESPERVDVRLKRIYEVHLSDAAGDSEVRYVLAKSVGWGWLGYHALVAGEKLTNLIPPVLGLRDGVLYTEWIPKRELPQVVAQDRESLIESLASYVAARTRDLSFGNNPTPDLANEGRHKGFEILANSLSRAYNSRMVAALKRSRIQRQLSHQNCSASVMTDSKMSPGEWIFAGSRLMKTDFEHHCQGKNELGMTDPAYDLADAIFQFELSDEESGHLIRSYAKQSGDVNVEERVFLNKLLAGMWGQNLATLGLQNSGLLSRRSEFHRQYVSAWNFMVRETIRECGKLCRRPREVRWSTPLVVTDIDGVLDRMVFGFPSTTAAGIKAVSLLHSHGFAIAVNTARTLQEVKQYCRSYGFVGGVAEYGGIVWDAVSDQELALVSPESLRQLEEVRNALQRIPGVFLNDDYRYSLRAFTYQNGGTIPLPHLLIQDLLAGLKADRLQVHHTGLDTAILAKETNKGTGLLSLLAFVGVATAETLAIGDSEPDLAMFRVAHRCFAPGNVSCRREARLLRCHIADLPYQPGLLQIARKITHPHGGTCNECRAVEAIRHNGNSLFVSLLSAADQKPRSLLLRNLIDPSVLAIFRK